MADPEAKLIRSFGRAFRMVEAWVEADLLETTRQATDAAFGDSPESRLVKVLASANEALPLYEISVRCNVSRRAVLESGRLRLALERMERSGVLVNAGTHHRPRFQLNPKDDRAKLLASLFVKGSDPRTYDWWSISAKSRPT